jgi:hypothetical protein
MVGFTPKYLSYEKPGYLTPQIQKLPRDPQVWGLGRIHAGKAHHQSHREPESLQCWIIKGWIQSWLMDKTLGNRPRSLHFIQNGQFSCDRAHEQGLSVVKKCSHTPGMKSQEMFFSNLTISGGSPRIGEVAGIRLPIDENLANNSLDTCSKWSLVGGKYSVPREIRDRLAQCRPYPSSDSSSCHFWLSGVGVMRI